MAFTFHFKAGAAQSREAGRYFSSVGNEVLGSGIEGLEPRQLVLTEDGHEPMPLRIWSANEPTSTELTALVPWLRTVRGEMGQMAKRDADLTDVPVIVTRWTDTAHGVQTFFAELLDPAHAFTDDEDNTLSVGVVAGRTVMLSARNVIFMKLDPERFGLAIANKGSFLIESVAEQMHAQARRA
ncbi:MAG: hypothetical protein JNM62_13750 [Flavobacteriales bacterium]|nr:hypothetical protein [Flavobacteriales bacterium]